MKEEFNIEEFEKSLGLTPRPMEKYNYKAYKEVNPNLTEEGYEYIRQCKAEWKILCGKKVTTHWGLVMLEPVSWLDTVENYLMRYNYTPPYIDHYNKIIKGDKL